MAGEVLVTRMYGVLSVHLISCKPKPVQTQDGGFVVMLLITVKICIVTVMKTGNGGGLVEIVALVPLNS